MTCGAAAGRMNSDWLDASAAHCDREGQTGQIEKTPGYQPLHKYVASTSQCPDDEETYVVRR